MKSKYVKKICIGAAIIIALFGVYMAVHAYGNSKIINRYADGFSKNPLGVYCKNDSNMVLAVNEASMFTLYTNLSVSDNKDNTALIVWVPLFKGEKEYGIIVNNSKDKISYQIKVNKSLRAVEAEDQKILDRNKESIERIKRISNDYWNL